MRGIAETRAMDDRASAVSAEWAAIVRRAKALDAGAFDEIVDAYAPRLYGFFQRMLGRGVDPEDLVQDVFLRVVQGIAGYREDGRFEAWLFKIAGNLARDRVRRFSTDLVAQAGDNDVLSEVADAAGATGTSDADRGRIDDGTKGRLEECLGRLPWAEREVILLRHYGELSFAEVAAYTASPLGTVLARGHRGLAKLRRWMEADA